jgi:hypothetical protein
MFDCGSGCRIVGLLRSDGTGAHPITHQQIVDLGPTSSEEAALIRLLLGSVEIQHKSVRKKLNQRRNYAVLGGPATSVTKPDGLKKLLSARGIDSDELDRYLRKTLKQRAFYKDVLLELCHYFINASQGASVVAFLHLYRFLERISYSFPMSYAAATDDFKGSFQALREFLKGGTETGELKFFESFVTTAVDPALRSVKSDIQGDSKAPPARGDCFPAARSEA